MRADLQLLTLSLPTWLGFARVSSGEAWVRMDLLAANSQNSWESLEM